MKKIFAFFCAAATIAAAASCTQKGIEILPDNNEGVTFRANACDITKVSVDDEFHAYWNTDDKIYLMDSEKNFDAVSIASTYDGQATAEFTSTVLSPDADRYFALVSPGTISQDEERYIIDRSYESDGSLTSAYVGFSGTDSKDKTFSFDCLTAIIRFTTTESNKKIYLISAPVAQLEDVKDLFYTSGSLTVSTDPTSAASVYELVPVGGFPYLSVIPDNSEPGTYYFGFFPGKYNCLAFVEQKVGYVREAVIYGEFEFEAGRIYDFGDIDSRMYTTSYSVVTPEFDPEQAETYNNYLELSLDNSIRYTTAKGNAANAPAFNASSREVRIYQAPSGQPYGGTLTIESPNGDQIKGVQLMIGSTDATFAYTIGNNTELSEDINVEKRKSYTLNGINDTKVTFYCTGTDKDHRLVFNGIRVTYVLDNREAQNLYFPVPTLDLEAYLGQSFDAPKVEGAMTSVTYTSSNTEVATVDATTGDVTLVGPGSTVITATAVADNTYKSGSASYNLTVIEPGIVGLKALQEKLLSYDKATDFTAEVTDAIVTSISDNGLHFYLEDAEAGVYCYNISENGLAVGDCLTGTITGRGYNYNGIPEVTKFEFSGSTSTATLPEQSVSLADFDGDGFQTYLCRRVKLSDVTIGDGFGGTDREGTLVEGQYTVGVRTASASSVTESYIQGSVIDLVCIPSFYKPTGADVEGRLMIGWDADITVKSTPTPTDLGLATLKPKLLAATSKAPYSGSVILENAVITGVIENNSKFNFYLEDAGAAIYCYGISGLGFDVVPGTTLDGTITVSGYNYNNGIAEVTTFSFEGQTTVSSDIPVTEVTTASLEENYDDLACRRISIKNVTVTDGFGGSDLDGSIMQDNTAATIRTASSAVVTQSYSTNANISLYGYPIYYKGNHQISIISDNDITVSGKMPGVITAATTKQMYVGDTWEVGATANSGATVSYSIDNSNVAFLSPVAVGLVEAKSAGTCTLTMTAPETDQYTAASLTCTITVVEAPVGTQYFQKVTTAPSDWSGTYLIVTEYDLDNQHLYALSGQAVNASQVLQNFGAYEDIFYSLSDNGIEATTTNRGYAVTIAKTETGHYSMYQGSKWLGLNANGNNLYFSDSYEANRDEWDIAFNSDVLQIINVKYPKNGDSDRFLQYNSGSPRFACYKAGQKVIAIYKLAE